MPKKKKYNYLDLINEDSYCRNFNLEIYVSWNSDNLQELKEKDKCDYDYNTCDEILKFIEYNYISFGYILHDKDIWTYRDYEEKKEYMDSAGLKVGDIKKPHYHCTIKFKNPRYKSTVAKELGIPFNKIVRCLTVDGSLKYDLHIDEDDKYPYDIDEFKGPLKERLIKLCQKLISEEEKSNKVIDLIISQSWSLPNLMREINKMGLYSHFIRGASIYKTMLEESNMGAYIDVPGSYKFIGSIYDVDKDCINLLNDGKIDLSRIS